MTEPAEALSKKKRIRAGHRASATRILNRIEAVLADPPADLDNLAQLKLSLQEKLETLKLLDSEIVEVTHEDDLEYEIERADSYKEGVYRALINIDKLMKISSTVPAGPTRTLAGPALTLTPTPKSDRVKLPKLTLRPFNGDLTMWTTFWDSFESAIHNSDDLSDVDKFNYLKSLLEKGAYDAISGLTLSSANYLEAITILKKRFGDKNQIVAKHMDTLLNVPAVTSSHSLKGLRHLYDDVESHIRSLRTLGITPDSYGSLLAPVLLSKLPQELRLIISRKTADTELVIDDLLKMMEAEITAQERTMTNSSQQPQQPRRNTNPTAAALLSGTPGNGPFCCYCRQAHSAASCKTVTQVSARKDILKKNGRCFLCLKRGHIIRYCRSPNRTCPKCSGKHHGSICERAQEASQQPPRGDSHQPTSTSSSQVAHGSGLNPGASPYAPTQTTATLCTGVCRGAVLLQTARTYAHNPGNPWQSMEVRILLDSGSQRSYITEQAQRQLSLLPEREQRLSIATFGATREEPKTCPVVNVELKLKDNNTIRVSLFVVPKICQPLIGQPISSCIDAHRHLAALDLADCSTGDSSMEVDILVGSDYYWELATGEVCRGSSGPIAIHTKLGWVLSGPTNSMDLPESSVNLVTTHVLRVDSQECENRGLEEGLRSFWELESLGISSPEKTLYEDFSKSVTFRDGRYEVSLPWREVHEPLPDNYQLSLGRLRSLLHRLKQTPDIFQEYNKVIQDQIERGIVEPVNDSTTSSSKVHYLPHHAVIRKDKSTTKVRVVYDASA